MIGQIGKEMGIHGARWHALHGCYFSDPSIASFLLERVAEVAITSRPDILIDLGGGTGFLLAELVNRGFVDAGLRLVNLDCSERQLAVASDKGICCLRGAITDIWRDLVDQEQMRFLFMMRSVLHYFGRDGLMPLLRHLRAQARVGEFFIHQAACFESKREADCMNMLYERMKTDKWYPTLDELGDCIAAAGWRTRSISRAPTLTLTSEDLACRYGLDENDIACIREEIARQFPDMMNVFKPMQRGFCAFLSYRVYACIAADHESSQNQ